MPRPLLACVLMLSAAATLLLSGCHLSALLADDTRKAAYKITDQRTLVLVDDDRTDGFGYPGVTNHVASRFMHDLREAKRVSDFVSLSEINSLAVTEGDDFRKLTVQQIGRRLNATQVVSIYIERVHLQRDAQLVKPEATVLVRLIDVEAGRRLFPASEEEARGHRMKVELDYRYSGEFTQAQAREMTHRLADFIGRDTARLFYDHKTHPAGYRPDR